MKTKPKSVSELYWLHKKEQGWGSSEAAAVLGVDPFTGLLKVVSRKQGKLPRFEGNWQTRMGHKMEPVVTAFFKEENPDRRVINRGKRKLFWHPEHKFMCCTPDRFQVYRGVEGILELKYVGPHMVQGWKRGPPKYVWIQLQHQLAVTGCPSGCIAVVMPDTPPYRQWLDIPRDDAFIEKELVPACHKAWQMVVDNIEPAADGSKSSVEVLAALYPARPGEVQVLSEHEVFYDDRRQWYAGRIKHYTQQKDHYTNLIRQAMQGANTGLLPNGVQYTYRQRGDSRCFIRDRAGPDKVQSQNEKE